MQLLEDIYDVMLDISDAAFERVNVLRVLCDGVVEGGSQILEVRQANLVVLDARFERCNFGRRSSIERVDIRLVLVDMSSVLVDIVA